MHLGPQQGLLEVHSPQMRLDCATNQAKQYTLVQLWKNCGLVGYRYGLAGNGLRDHGISESRSRLALSVQT